MTVTGLDRDIVLLRREPTSKFAQYFEVLRGHVRASKQLSTDRADASCHQHRSIMSAKFYPHAYVGEGARLYDQCAFSHLMRTILAFMNTGIVAIGCVVSIVGGVEISYWIHSGLGIAFSIFMLFGAWQQRRSLNYKRTYGVWNGPCPDCHEPLNINAKHNQAKSVCCSSCGSRIMVNEGIFVVVPWYTQPEPGG